MQSMCRQHETKLKLDLVIDHTILIEVPSVLTIIRLSQVLDMHHLVLTLSVFKESLPDNHKA